MSFAKMKYVMLSVTVERVSLGLIFIYIFHVFLILILVLLIQRVSYKIVFIMSRHC